jgi:hypothetical protein
MTRLFFAVALAALTVPGSGRAQTARGDYFQQDVHYTIKARLDTEAHTLSGSETIVYTNNSPDTLREFYLHLYPNAYKSRHTPFMRDYRKRYNFNWFDLPDKYRGWLDITNVEIDGSSTTPRVSGTLASMNLPRPLLPGASMTLDLDFESKIRAHIGRAGYQGNHYDMAQWYPKVVVYDQNGFHPDQFMTGEFYGEFGTFDVHIELPQRYVVVATGTVQSGDPGWSKKGGDKKDSGDTYKTVRFHAENVHDFAWCADPSFVVQDSTVNGVDIMSVFRRRNAATWKDSTLAHGIRAMRWLGDKVGDYPYPQVAIVDGLLGGGMEYPMLVMDGRASLTLTLHEVGHIYFYGILANDERAEAWLDEGFTSFQTDWYMLQHYPESGVIRSSLNWYQRLTPQFTRLENTRRRLFPILREDYGERIATRSEEFVNSYRAMVYWKASLMYRALQYVVGEETFDRILAEYYARWKLKHVNEQRFIDVCEEVSGQDLDWFFGQWLHSRKTCDYKIAEVKTGTSASGDAYRTRVKIERKGEMVMPLKLRFTFKGGTVQETEIDTREARLRTIIKEFDFPQKLSAVALNPENHIMDIDMSDNFSPRRRALDIDWPNSDYYPEDAYQIRARPEVWYNYIDEAKFGLHFNTGYARWAKRYSAGIYYGTKSKRLDFSIATHKRFRLFWNQTMLNVSGYKMEGREDFSLELDTRKRKTLIRPPTHRLLLALNYHGMTETQYVVNPEAYQKGGDFSYYFQYSVDPQADVATSRFTLGFRGGRKWLAGDFDYTSFTAEWWMATRPEAVAALPVDGGLRLFFGAVGGSMPLQRKFQLAGGGPLEEEKHFFLRSPGAIWKEAHYHQPGGGNLRGYYEGSFGVNQLLAMNLEIGRRLPLLSKAPNKWLGSIDVVAFGDVGTIIDRENPVGSSARVQALVDGGILRKGLFDAGLGLRFHRALPFWDLRVRFDSPFYVNHPEINGESKETDYRYILSLESIF